MHNKCSPLSQEAARHARPPPPPRLQTLDQPHPQQPRSHPISPTHRQTQSASTRPIDLHHLPQELNRSTRPKPQQIPSTPTNQHHNLTPSTMKPHKFPPIYLHNHPSRSLNYTTPMPLKHPKPHAQTSHTSFSSRFSSPPPAKTYGMERTSESQDLVETE